MQVKLWEEFRSSGEKDEKAEAEGDVYEDRNMFGNRELRRVGMCSEIFSWTGSMVRALWAVISD